MNKNILIAGGAGVVVVVGVLVLRSRMSATNDEATAAPPVNADLSTMLYGPPAISGGISSGDQGGLGLPGMTPGLPLSTGVAAPGTTPGVASLESMMAGAFTNANLLNTAKVQSNIYTNDSNALAGINYGSFGGNADITHIGSKTAISVNTNQDPNAINYSAYLDSVYKDLLGRDADAGGKAYWLDAIKRGGNLNDVYSAIQGSTEYQKKTGAVSTSATAAAYNPVYLPKDSTPTYTSYGNNYDPKNPDFASGNLHDQYGSYTETSSAPDPTTGAITVTGYATRS